MQQTTSGGVRCNNVPPASYTRGMTETKMKIPMMTEHTGSAITHPLYSTRTAERERKAEAGSEHGESVHASGTSSGSTHAAQHKAQTLYNTHTICHETCVPCVCVRAKVECMVAHRTTQSPPRFPVCRQAHGDTRPSCSHRGSQLKRLS